MADQDKLPIIIKKISQYQCPGKKALQKLIYLIERKGLNLGFSYSIHYYGPYSSELDYAIHGLEMQGLIEIRPEGRSHNIYTTEHVEAETTFFSLNDEKIIDNVLETFASLSAHELELITTTDYVARELCQQGSVCQEQAIVDGVQVIKGQKFSAEKIMEAIAQLRSTGYRWN